MDEIEEIHKMFRDEHLKELKKYSLGELIEAIECRNGISRHDVGRHELVISVDTVLDTTNNARGVLRYGTARNAIL